MLKDDIEYLYSVDLMGDKIMQTNDAYTESGLHYGCMEGSLFTDMTALNLLLLLLECFVETFHMTNASEQISHPRRWVRRHVV